MISELDRKFLKTGFKEVLKVISKKAAEKVFVAEDIAPSMKEKLIFETSQSGYNIIYVENRKALGDMCGIDVGASCAAIIKH